MKHICTTWTKALVFNSHTCIYKQLSHNVKDVDWDVFSTHLNTHIGLKSEQCPIKHYQLAYLSSPTLRGSKKIFNQYKCQIFSISLPKVNHYPLYKKLNVIQRQMVTSPHCCLRNDSLINWQHNLASGHQESSNIISQFKLQFEFQIKSHHPVSYSDTRCNVWCQHPTTPR